NLCSASVSKTRVKLGGQGKVVDGKAYIEVVKDRRATTLLKIIFDNVEEGTTIISDTWSSYNRITSLKNFNHITVNHKFNFVGPISGACTNKIEGLWNHAKKKFKEMHAEFYPINKEFTLENIVLSEDEVSILSINEGENENFSDFDDTEDQNDSLDGTWSSRITNEIILDAPKTSYEKLLESKIDSLNFKLQTLNLETNQAKIVSLNLEKKSFENVPLSNEATKKVDEVLKNSENDLVCEIC
ncbi:unnamed protein product, partial [Brachionus calyciflorus]